MLYGWCASSEPREAEVPLRCEYNFTNLIPEDALYEIKGNGGRVKENSTKRTLISFPFSLFLIIIYLYYIIQGRLRW